MPPALDPASASERLRSPRRPAAHLRRRPQHGRIPREWGTGAKSTVTMTPSQDAACLARATVSDVDWKSIARDDDRGVRDRLAAVSGDPRRGSGQQFRYVARRPNMDAADLGAISRDTPGHRAAPRSFVMRATRPEGCPSVETRAKRLYFGGQAGACWR